MCILGNGRESNCSSRSRGKQATIFHSLFKALSYSSCSIYHCLLIHSRALQTHKSVFLCVLRTQTCRGFLLESLEYVRMQLCMLYLLPGSLSAFLIFTFSLHSASFFPKSSSAIQWHMYHIITVGLTFTYDLMKSVSSSYFLHLNGAAECGLSLVRVRLLGITMCYC